MTDYGHELQFGVFIAPDAGQADAVIKLGRLADTLGLDLVTSRTTRAKAGSSYEERELIEPLARLGFY